MHELQTIDTRGEKNLEHEAQGRRGHIDQTPAGIILDVLLKRVFSAQIVMMTEQV